MYESEVNSAVESVECLPSEVKRRFAELRGKITVRTTLPWGEHCTECVWPTCYASCELYAPRVDGACRQFVEGMVRVDHLEALSGYLLKLQFKRWAKLWTVGNIDLQPLSKASRREQFNNTIGAIGRGMPLPASLRPRLLHKISYLRRRSAELAPLSPEMPDYFLLECYNPDVRTIDLTFTVRYRSGKGLRPFQKLISVPHGFTRAKISFPEISKVIDTREPFELEIVPNDAENAILYFGLMDFVKERGETLSADQTGSQVKHWKCIVWDLDNTLWDGTLIEDGPEKIRLRQSVVDVIKRLDERGILHSIASKNNRDDALAVLRAHGLDEYFLHPQISWRPKSQSIEQIAQLLNIGVDTIAFVDDQEFEREEVRAGLPETTVVDAREHRRIPDRPECQVPVTSEGKMRRHMYREEEERQHAIEAHNGDYQAFLKDCHIELGIVPLDTTNLERVYELAQRTNQLNFSGSRYSRAELGEIMSNPSLQTFVMDCVDRFGAYGIVGFAIVDGREPRLLDLMFSCRIQAKRVEHAVLVFLLKRYLTGETGNFYANYKKTTKNAPGGKVFEEVGFRILSEQEGVTSFVFKQGTENVDDKIVKIIERRTA